MDDQGVRLYNFNPAWGGGSAFRVVLNNGGDAYEFEYQIIGDFVGRERINRIDQHFDVCHAQEISKGLNITSTELQSSTDPKGARQPGSTIALCGEHLGSL